MLMPWIVAPASSGDITRMGGTGRIMTSFGSEKAEASCSSMYWTSIEQRVVHGVVVLDLHGQITLTGEDEHTLLRAVQRVLDAGYRHVVLNLANVSYLDSTGVGEIVGAFTRVAREGGHLKLCGVSARTNELLRAANIDSVVPSYGSELAALESF
jgi:anti-sigma B factor antagonist